MRYNKYFKMPDGRGGGEPGIACKCGECGFGDRVEHLDERLIWIATCVRIHFNAAVTITSGCRCKRHNANERGSKDSQHLLGTGIDFKVKGVEPKVVQAFLDDLLAGRFGLGYGKTFTHLDTRATPARFNY